LIEGKFQAVKIVFPHSYTPLEAFITSGDGDSNGGLPPRFPLTLPRFAFSLLFSPSPH
jgi:hypothetical protein